MSSVALPGAGGRATPTPAGSREVTRRAHRWAAAGPLALRAVFAGYLGLLVALPVGALVVSGLAGGPGAIVAALADRTARDAIGLSVWTAAVAAAINAVVGTAIAWVLVRFEVPGRRLIAALVDLPLSLPTLVAGLLIVALFGPQSPPGAALDAVGLPIAFAPAGIVLALLFVTLPFVVRAVEPVMLELDPAEEEAAVMLGATRWTVFRRVLLPPLAPAIAAGAVQVFGRSMAEFGSIVAMSGNIPHHTLNAPTYVLGLVEAGEPQSAAAVSLVLVVAALGLQVLAGRLARGGRRG